MPHAAAGSSRRSAQTRTSSTIVAVAAAMSCTQEPLAQQWYSWPPVKRFGVGRPRAVSIAPSVPPRIDARRGSTPDPPDRLLGRLDDARVRLDAGRMLRYGLGALDA